MRLQLKAVVQLLVGFAAVMAVSQAVQYFQAERCATKLTGSSQALLQQRELQNVRNTQAAVDFSVSRQANDRPG